ADPGEAATGNAAGSGANARAGNSLIYPASASAPGDPVHEDAPIDPSPRRGSWFAPGILAGVVLCAAAATPAAAQSLTAGALSGTVAAAQGRPLDGADVTVLDVASGVTRTVTTTRTGRFQFALLPAGEYEILAERLGYRPRRVRGVPVRPGGVVDVPVPLAPARPPVAVIDSSQFAPGVLQGGAAGSSQWFTPFAITALPDRGRGLSALGRLSTASSETLETEGLPA